MKAKHTTKLLLIYFSKGLSFLSSYVLLLVLFNKLEDKEFSYYAAVGYLGFIVLTILDFGFSNYVILNKEINANEQILVGLNKGKLILTIFLALIFVVISIIYENTIYALLACISVQQAFNFDGIYKIQNKYNVIILKFFLGAIANFLLIGLLSIFIISSNYILIYTYITGAIINIYTFRSFTKSIFTSKKIDLSILRSTIYNFNWQPILLYITFNFFCNFTYAYYSYITKFTAEHLYYNSNIIIISFISNLYVVYLIYREYVFTTSSLKPILINIGLILFLFIGSLLMYHYHFVVSLFGKNVVVSDGDKLLSSILFITLILKTEVYFRLLKDFSFLKFLSFIQVLVNCFLVYNSQAICHFFAKNLFFLPIIIFDLLVIASSIMLWFFTKISLKKTFSL